MTEDPFAFGQAPVADSVAPAFQRIKDHVLAHVRRGDWPQGHAVPTETQLAQWFGVSRMTVNRAMRELAQEGVVRRVQGAGTFVADAPVVAPLLEIRNIAEEIQARGHRHRSELLLLERVPASADWAQTFERSKGDVLYRSVLVHFDNDTPIQMEDRVVNPEVAPDYVRQRFEQQTPTAYLMSVAPLQDVRFELEAVMPPPPVRAALRMTPREPALLLTRRTRSQGRVATLARMWHPASRYRLTGGF